MKRFLLMFVLGCMPSLAQGETPPPEEDVRTQAIEPMDPPPAEAQVSLAEALAEKERMLKRREVELQQAALDLEEARRQVEARVRELEAKLKALQEMREDRANRLEDEKVTRLLQLIRTVEKMDPESAAPYLDRFETDTAAEILHGMNMRKAATVISFMKPSKAAILSRWFLENGHPAPPYDPKRDSKKR
ncbi:MAG: MotE family protein [Myxococcota bacterium]